MREGLHEADRIQPRRVGRTGTREPGRPSSRWLAAEQADPDERPVGKPLTGVAMGAVQDQPGPQLGLGVGCIVECRARPRRPAGEAASRGS